MLSFMILGLPAHPLIVHGAVVGIPLAALGVLAYVALPSKRSTLWWPVIVTVAVAWLFSFFAGSTGETLEHALHHSKFIEEHAMWADRLGLAMHVLAASAILGLIVERYGVKFGSARQALRMLTATVASIAAVASLVLVAIVGHLGAEAAWHDSPAASKAMQTKTAP